jgi:hypothetical protein
MIIRHSASVGRVPVTHVETFAIADEFAVRLIFLLHLTPVDRIIGVNEHVSVDEPWLVGKLGEQLLVGLHLHLVV